MSWIWCIDISIINKIWFFYKCYCALISHISIRCPAWKIIIHNIFLCNTVICCNSCYSLRNIYCCSICINRIIFCITSLLRLIARHFKPAFILNVTTIYLSIKEGYFCILTPRSSKISCTYLKFITACYCTVSKYIANLSCCSRGWLMCCNITTCRASTITCESKLTSIKHCVSITKYVICITLYMAVFKVHISCWIASI